MLYRPFPWFTTYHCWDRLPEKSFTPTLEALAAVPLLVQHLIGCYNDNNQMQEVGINPYSNRTLVMIGSYCAPFGFWKVTTAFSPAHSTE